VFKRAHAGFPGNNAHAQNGVTRPSFGLGMKRALTSGGL